MEFGAVSHNQKYDTMISITSRQILLGTMSFPLSFPYRSKGLQSCKGYKNTRREKYSRPPTKNIYTEPYMRKTQKRLLKSWDMSYHVLVWHVSVTSLSVKTYNGVRSGESFESTSMAFYIWGMCSKTETKPTIAFHVHIPQGLPLQNVEGTGAQSCSQGWLKKASLGR